MYRWLHFTFIPTQFVVVVVVVVTNVGSRMCDTRLLFITAQCSLPSTLPRV